MSSRFLNAAGAAAIAAMLVLVRADLVRTDHVPVGAFSARRSAGPGAVRRRRSGNADPAAGKPAPATDRPERGVAIPQPAARGAAAPARRRAAGARRPAADGAAQRGRGSALQFSPVRRRGSRAIRNKAIRSRARASQQGYPQAQPGYDQQPQIASPAPIVQDPAAPQAGGRRRGDAFDPNQNPNAPGAPRALGGGQMPMSSEAAVGAPGGRGPGEPLNLGGPRDPGGAPCRRPLQPHRHRAAPGPAPAPR